MGDPVYENIKQITSKVTTNSVVDSNIAYLHSHGYKVDSAI